MLVLKGGNPYSVMKTTSLLRVNLFQTSFNSTDHSDILDAKIELREMNIQCLEIIIVGHLNINLTRNKFDALSFVIDTNINILLVSETKLDDSFLSIQFRLKGFCTLCELNDLSV